MLITPETIETDIQGFQARILEAKKKLETLPVGYSDNRASLRSPDYADYKKHQAQRRALQQDITHVQQLIRYATEGLGNHP